MILTGQSLSQVEEAWGRLIAQCHLVFPYRHSVSYQRCKLRSSVVGRAAELAIQRDRRLVFVRGRRFAAAYCFTLIYEAALLVGASAFLILFLDKLTP